MVINCEREKSVGEKEYLFYQKVVAYFWSSHLTISPQKLCHPISENWKYGNEVFDNLTK